MTVLLCLIYEDGTALASAPFAPAAPSGGRPGCVTTIFFVCAMGLGLSTRRRKRSGSRNRRGSLLSDDTGNTEGTRGTSKSQRSGRSASSGTSKSSKGSRRVRGGKKAEARAVEATWEREVGVVPVGGRCSMIGEDVEEEEEKKRSRAMQEMPTYHPFGVNDEAD